MSELKEVSQKVITKRKGIINGVEEFQNKLLEPDPYSVVVGIDISQRDYEVTIYVPPVKAEAKRPQYFKATFENSLSGLDALASTLQTYKVDKIVCESTASYWMDLTNRFNYFEGYENGPDALYEVTVLNPAMAKMLGIPKTDRMDATLLAILGSAGLGLRSFIPHRLQYAVRSANRELMRHVKKRSSEKAKMSNWFVQQGMGALKSKEGIPELTGYSGMTVIKGIIGGQREVAVLTQNLDPRLRSPERLAYIQRALQPIAQVDPFAIRQLALMVRKLEFMNSLVPEYQDLVWAAVEHWADRTQVNLQSVTNIILSIPGFVDPRLKKNPAKKGSSALLTVFAEVGLNVKPWPESKKFARWVGTAPTVNSSGGKQKSNQIRGGNPFLKEQLVQISSSIVSSTKAEYAPFRDKYWRIKSHREANQAKMGVANSLARTLYACLRDGAFYQARNLKTVKRRKKKR
jgi:transposase